MRCYCSCSLVQRAVTIKPPPPTLCCCSYHTPPLLALSAASRPSSKQLPHLRAFPPPHPQRPNYHRYFNESSPPTPTLALDGAAPVAATFVAASSGSVPGRDKAAPAPAPARAAFPGGAGSAGTLHVNLQSCFSTDRSASDGVLHVLAFAAGDGDGDGFDHNNSGAGIGDSLGDGGGGDTGSGAGAGAGSGVLVPDVLELTYAHGFRETYEAIVTASSDSGSAAAAAAGDDAAGGGDDEADKDTVKGASSVARALRGRVAHTLLAVADDVDVDDGPRSNRRKGEAASPASRPELVSRGSGDGAPGDWLRYGLAAWVRRCRRGGDAICTTTQ